jgi:hypothetical protein
MHNGITVVDNFFDNFHNIKDRFKEIPLYGLDEFIKLNSEDPQKWPGKRSLDFYETEPFLFNLFLNEFHNKFDNFFNNKKFWCKSYAHLRLDEDNEKDFIHTDPIDYSLLVYVSETNLNSGTCFYDDKNNATQTVNFVQNRAVLFPGYNKHCALNNHGINIDNGRLTLNAFFSVTGDN